MIDKYKLAKEMQAKKNKEQFDYIDRMFDLMEQQKPQDNLEFLGVQEVKLEYTNAAILQRQKELQGRISREHIQMLGFLQSHGIYDNEVGMVPYQDTWSMDLSLLTTYPSKLLFRGELITRIEVPTYDIPVMTEEVMSNLSWKREKLIVPIAGNGDNTVIGVAYMPPGKISVIIRLITNRANVGVDISYDNILYCSDGPLYWKKGGTVMSPIVIPNYPMLQWFDYLPERGDRDFVLNVDGIWYRLNHKNTVNLMMECDGKIVEMRTAEKQVAITYDAQELFTKTTVAQTDVGKVFSCDMITHKLYRPTVGVVESGVMVLLRHLAPTIQRYPKMSQGKPLVSGRWYVIPQKKRQIVDSGRKKYLTRYASDNNWRDLGYEEFCRSQSFYYQGDKLVTFYNREYVGTVNVYDQLGENYQIDDILTKNIHVMIAVSDESVKDFQMIFQTFYDQAPKRVYLKKFGQGKHECGVIEYLLPKTYIQLRSWLQVFGQPYGVKYVWRCDDAWK